MMQSESFVTLRDLTYSRALLLKVQLEQQGINSFIKPGDPLVDLLVEAAHVHAAQQVMQDMQFVSGQGKEQMVSSLRRTRRILVPVDFSSRSIKAAHYALELARALKAELRLLHIWFYGGADGLIFNEMYAFQADLGPLMRQQEQQAMNQLNELTEVLQSRVKTERMRGVSISADLVRGSTVDSILSISDEFRPGLIVMGTRGKNRDALSLIGSTTSRLMSRSMVPVLAVPEGYDSSAFIAPKSVAYLTHFEANDVFVLHKLISFVKPFRSKLYCLHLESEPEAFIDRLQMKHLREQFMQSAGAGDIECGLISAQHPVEGLEAFVQEKNIDVIAIVLRKRNLLEQLFEPSLTRKLLYQTHLPLLVFREM